MKTHSQKSAQSFMSGFAIGNERHVYYVASDQHVHQLYFNGGWNDQDLTQNAQPPGPLAVPGSFMSALPVGVEQHVYYVASEQHVHQLSFPRGGPWTDQDLTQNAQPSGPPAVPGTFISAFPIRFPNRVEYHVYYVASEQDVHQLYFDGAWHDQDLTQTSIQGGALAVPGSFTSAFPIGNEQHVYYVSIDQHVHQLYFNGAWNDQDLTQNAQPPGPLAVPGSFMSAFPVGIEQHVYYVASDQHVHQLSFTGGASWIDQDLTRPTDPALRGPLAAAGSWILGFPIGSDHHVLYSAKNQPKITYTEVIRGAAVSTTGQICTSSPCTLPAGTLGGLSFGGSNGPTVDLTFTFVGDAGNVAPFSAPVSGGTLQGFVNIAGPGDTVSVAVQDASGAVPGQGKFLPADGMFVSVNKGGITSASPLIGFGSCAPGGVTASNVAYPYALLGGTGGTNLQSNFSSSGVSAGSLSCVGWNGAVGTCGPSVTTAPRVACGPPLALATTAGPLTIFEDFVAVGGTFSVALDTYTLNASKLTPASVISLGTATSTITVTPAGGYNSTVMLGCKVVAPFIPSGPPPTCSLSTNTVNGGSGTATLSVTASSHSPTATFSIIITGIDGRGQAPDNGAQAVSVTVVGHTGGGDPVSAFTFAGLLALWGFIQIWHRKKTPLQ